MPEDTKLGRTGLLGSGTLFSSVYSGSSECSFFQVFPVRVLPEKQNCGRYIVRDLVQRVGFCKRGGWQGKSDICGAGREEGQAGALGRS